MLKLSSVVGPALFASTAAFNFAIRTLAAKARKNLPPVAEIRPQKVVIGEKKGEYRGPCPMNPPVEHIDNYYWLRDDERKREEVLSYIRAENDYTSIQTAHLKSFEDEIYAEMLLHLKETDEEVPYPHGSYYYYSRTKRGLSYKIHCRRNREGEEEVVLDENLLAEGREYSDVCNLEPSPDHSLLAYGVDNSGYETYALRVKQLPSGEHLADELQGSDGQIEWGSDASTLFYCQMDAEHRPNRVFAHKVGRPQSEDVCLIQEDDARFWIHVSKSASGRYLFVSADSSETSDVYILDLSAVNDVAMERYPQMLRQVVPRQPFLRYEIEHKPSTHGNDDELLIVTNLNGAKNMRLMSVPVNQLGAVESWREVVPYNSKIQIEHLQPFRDYLAIFGREGGLTRLWVASMTDISKWTQVEFDDPCHTVSCGPNHVFERLSIRLNFSSLTSPKTVMEYNMSTGLLTTLKQEEVPYFESSDYVSKRIEITARDGTKIPVSMVYHKSVIPETGDTPTTPAPFYLYGYGSYGICIDPNFDSKRLPALDRGVIYAIAHIRGGGEMGRSWYEDQGKYLTKRNTFTDFGDCAAELCRLGFTSSDRLCVVGRSAGGLLIGAFVNMFPSLAKVAVADVPFVDVVTTVSDPSIPLTVTEWEEWGNPNEEKYYNYMKSYSPYDNVEAKPYPTILVTAGLNDPRVGYWEPAKWVAKLRATKTDDNLLLLKTDTSSGHFSASDRYKYLRESSFELSFVLDQIGARNLVVANNSTEE